MALIRQVLKTLSRTVNSFMGFPTSLTPFNKKSSTFLNVIHCFRFRPVEKHGRWWNRGTFSISTNQGKMNKCHAVYARYTCSTNKMNLSHFSEAMWIVSDCGRARMPYMCSGTVITSLGILTKMIRVFIRIKLDYMHTRVNGWTGKLMGSASKHRLGACTKATF